MCVCEIVRYCNVNLLRAIGLPHIDSQSNEDMEIKPVNPIDGLETRSQSSLSEDLPVDASNTPTPPTIRNAALNIPDAGTLSSLGGNLTVLHKEIRNKRENYQDFKFHIRIMNFFS